MNEVEKRALRGILSAARVPVRDHDWMIESLALFDDSDPYFTAFETAREHYSRTYKPIPPATIPSSDYYAGINDARQRVMVARYFGSDAELAEAMSTLRTEIAIFQHRLEESTRSA